MKKMFPIFIALAMMFVLTGVASAGDGTINDPIEILYVYASDPSYATYPDLNTAGPQEYHTRSASYYINVTSINGYLDDNWVNPRPSQTFSDYANDSYADFDIVFVDMVNMYQDQFATGALDAAEDGKLLTSIFTGPDNSTCDMPEGFAIRDTANLSQVLADGMTPNPYYNLNFTTDFFAVHDSLASWPANSSECTAMALVLITGYLNLWY